MKVGVLEVADGGEGSTRPRSGHDASHVSHFGVGCLLVVGEVGHVVDFVGSSFGGCLGGLFGFLFRLFAFLLSSCEDERKGKEGR